MQTSERIKECGHTGGDADLFRGLVDCLERERKHLKEIDVEALWAVMEEKKRIIEALSAIPDEERAPDAETSRLKEEIRRRTEENIGFIKESLSFFDELIAILAGGEPETRGYRPGGSGRLGTRPLLYKREA